jgi:peptidoglycan/LPS O-acetylase OafA/YrhL
MIFQRSPIEINPRLGATLDFLRWTSALAVLAGHVRMFLFPPMESIGHAWIPLNTFYLVTGFGNQAVMVFFVLSGFLVGGRAAEKLSEGTFRMGDYMADRVSRLYPVFFVGLLLTATLDSFGMNLFYNANCYKSTYPMLRDLVNYNMGSQLSIVTFLSNLLMLQGIVTPSFGTNGPLWSLSMEFWYYILFPLLLIPFYARAARVRWTSIGILVLVLCLLAMNPNYYALFVVWLLGVAARRLHFPFRNSSVAFGLLALTLVNSRIGFGPSYLRDLVIGVGCMLVIVSVHNGGGGIACGAALSKKMANFSYSLYCCHFPIVVFSVAILASRRDVSMLSMQSRFLIAAALTTFCLCASYGISLFTEAKTAFFRNRLKSVMPAAIRATPKPC